MDSAGLLIISGRGRRIAMENLGIAFGDTKSIAEKKRISRLSLQHVGATVLTLFWMPRLTLENFEQTAVVDAAGLKIFRMYPPRESVLAITPHFGDWEMLGVVPGSWDLS